MDDNTVNEWADSFEIDSNSEEPDTPETPEVQNEDEVIEDEQVQSTEESEDQKSEDEKTEDEQTDEVEEDSSEEDTDKDEQSKDDKEEESAKEDDTKPEEPAPALTRDDIKAVLQEAEQERTSYVEEIKNTAQEVLDTFYPEGIDRTLRDADGDPIKSVEDVMDRINPRTGENFTEEEAGRWLLAEQQKLNQQIDELEQSAQRVAETNIELRVGANRVVNKYGDFLSKNPEVADKIKDLYERTLRRDPKTGITLEAPVDVETFYDTYLTPYLSGTQAQSGQPKPAPKPKSNPTDRADLPTTNGNDNLSKEEREWAEIAKEYQSQRN